MPSGRSLPHEPATDILRSIAEGHVSAAEAVQAHLDQIDRLEPQLNAFVDVRGEAALAEARAQDDAAARGEARGSLGGLPVSVKSAFEVAGLRWETGSPAHEGAIAVSDAVAVARLRAAGAIVLGTTNVAEMLMGYETDNPLHGRTVNPWDPTRTPGGSSGGESAAIAAGLSGGGIGSDGGGSIRVPAHFSGICGLKPTPGRIPATGHQPACLGPFSLIGVVGPMARTVGDLQALFAVLAGWDDADPMAVPLAVRAEPGRHRHLRIGWFEDDGSVPVTPETRGAVRAAASGVQRAGFEVEPFFPPALLKARALWDVFFCETGALLLSETHGGVENALPILEAFEDTRPSREPFTARRLAHAWIDRDLVRAELLSQMAIHQVLVCPVAAVPAFRHGERAWTIAGTEVRYLDAMVYTQWFNVLGNPAVVVPVGRSPEGLPIGVQVVGRPFEEELVLEVAAAIERECGGYVAPPLTSRHHVPPR
jgi:Asp-tRNA(Asn)/Glu-tRNA(Gln) amidotransferase A subunit family amidase